MKMTWLSDTGDVQIPCMNPECIPDLDVSLSPTDAPNLYMGSCPDCYTGYKLEIYPPSADAVCQEAERRAKDVPE